MDSNDSYQLYLLHYQQIRNPETPRSRTQKALEMDLSDEKFMSEGRLFNEDDYNRFMENPFPEKPKLVWDSNTGGYEND